MKFLYEIDEKILDRIEHFCHALQRAIGLTNFDIARYGVVLATLCGFIVCLNISHPRDLEFIMTIFIWYSACVTYIVFSVERAIGSEVSSGKHMNPYRIHLRGVRVQYLVLMCLFFYMNVFAFILGRESTAWFIVHHLCVSIVFYLISCTPLPPVRSRLSEFLSKLTLSSLEVQPNES